MKKILTFGLALMIALTVSAQKNVTRFLGIPVDGTKSEMIQKLKAKGYTYNASLDHLEGEFNGRYVNISVVTNNNKVWRIMVTDAYSTRSETEIRHRFNTLCQQFRNNEKYIPAFAIPTGGYYEIGSDEDISYEIRVNDKFYEAYYYQITEADKDTAGITEWMRTDLPDTTLAKIDSLSSGEFREIMLRGLRTLFSPSYIEAKVSHKSVWFRIVENYGKYYIALFYDNELNKANGEDL